MIGTLVWFVTISCTAWAVMRVPREILVEIVARRIRHLQDAMMAEPDTTGELTPMIVEGNTVLETCREQAPVLVRAALFPGVVRRWAFDAYHPASTKRLPPVEPVEARSNEQLSAMIQVLEFQAELMALYFKLAAVTSWTAMFVWLPANTQTWREVQQFRARADWARREFSEITGPITASDAQRIVAAMPQRVGMGLVPQH